jgi:hypothetical protein
MKRARTWIDPDAPAEPERAQGSYPPDIAWRRRQLGLPVTPEEHAAYARGEMREPPVTVAQMAATLQRVLPRCSPTFAAALRDIAARVARARRDPGEEG